MDEHAKPRQSTGSDHRGLQRGGELTAESVFGDFRILKALSFGLLGGYYRVEDLRSREAVTLAVFHSSANGDENFLRRLRDLKRRMSGLQNEAIPKIRGVLVVEGRSCLLLDPVKGHTLSDYFKAHGHPGESGIGLPAMTRILEHLFTALSEVHSKGIEHLDLASDLILVQEDGSLRILGTGVKSAMGGALFESIVSASVLPIVGRKEVDRLDSFDVISPEYRSGLKEDSRADVYGVGVIAYWLVTGRKPKETKLRQPSALVEEVAGEWDLFFEKMLQRDQEQRFSSCKIAKGALKKNEKRETPKATDGLETKISQIPIPKGIEDRGLLASRSYRLVMILLLGVSLIAAMALFLRQIRGHERVVEGRSIVLAVNSSEANIAIQTEPERVRVEFLGESWSFMASEGMLELVLAPGDYSLQFAAAGYVSEVVPVTMDLLERERMFVQVALERAKGDLLVQTEPGALILALDATGQWVRLGQADQVGRAYFERILPEGSYDLRVEKESFVSRTLPGIRVEREAVAELEVALDPVTAAALVESDPAGGRVLVDGIEVGRTPTGVEGLAPGEVYRIEVNKVGYRAVERRIKPSAGERLAVDFGALVEESGSLLLEVTLTGEPVKQPLLNELELLVDGQAGPLQEADLGALPTGATRLQLRHPLYDSAPATVTISDNQTHFLALSLQPKPGIFSLKLPEVVEPELLIDGQPVDLSQLPLQVQSGRAVEVELRMKDYLTMRRQLNLEPTERFVWEINPVPIPGPRIGEPWTVPYVGMELSWLPAGAFEMGSPIIEHGRLPNEGPVTEVAFSRGFWMARFEVTQRQFLFLKGRNPSLFEGLDRPVERVSWQAAVEFCEQLTERERAAGRLPEGYRYRLPSEAEWEYGARAGSESPFYWGARADASLGQFNGVYPIDRSDGLRSPRSGYGTTLVGQYQPNQWGLHDLHGNVREWTLDRFNGRLPGGRLLDPGPREAGDRITVRGGGWEDTATRVRSAARESVSPDTESAAIGFRVVLAPDR